MPKFKVVQHWDRHLRSEIIIEAEDDLEAMDKAGDIEEGWSEPEDDTAREARCDGVCADWNVEEVPDAPAQH